DAAYAQRRVPTSPSCLETDFPREGQVTQLIRHARYQLHPTRKRHCSSPPAATLAGRQPPIDRARHPPLCPFCAATARAAAAPRRGDWDDQLRVDPISRPGTHCCARAATARAATAAATARVAAAPAPWRLGRPAPRRPDQPP